MLFCYLSTVISSFNKQLFIELCVRCSECLCLSSHALVWTMEDSYFSIEISIISKKFAAPFVNGLADKPHP